jgi:hypothetical protein
MLKFVLNQGSISKRLLIMDKPEKKDLEQYLGELVTIQKYFQDIFLNNQLITDLSRNRVKQISQELMNIIDLIQSLNNLFDVNFKRIKLIMLMDSIDKIKIYLTDPLSFFPSVNLWLLCDKEPIGVCTIKSTDIVWSKNKRERGYICNKLIYTDIKVKKNSKTWN